MLLGGGNAFDASVAVAATLNVVEPMSSSIAGNGFSTVFDASTGSVHSLAMAGAAPLAVDADSMSEEELSMGYGAACTPGNLGGYLALIERFGTSSLADTLKYAILQHYNLEKPHFLLTNLHFVISKNRYAIEYAEGHPVSEALASSIASQVILLYFLLQFLLQFLLYFLLQFSSCEIIRVRCVVIFVCSVIV